MHFKYERVKVVVSIERLKWYMKESKALLQESNVGLPLAGTWVSELSLYPINLSSFLALPNCNLDEKGIPYHLSPVGYHPTTIVQYALAQWNQYLTTREDQHCRVFLAQARWLVEQEISIGEDASGWPISFPHHDILGSGSWLSSTAQGGALSVLLRAHQLTHEEIFLEIVHRAVRTFERDILDGGVSAPVGEDGVFFEEMAIYPAAHALSGFIFALFGLYDYRLFAGSAQIEKLIDRSIRTLHNLIEAFDVGFWTYTDLLHKHLASSSDLKLQVDLLEALADYSGCDHCSSIAARWKGYQKRLGSRLRYLIASRYAAARHALLSRVRTGLFPAQQVSAVTRVCVALTAFPVTGGIRAVLTGVTQATSDIWQIEYLTHSVGANPEKFIVHQFGTKYMASWQFPGVWLYIIAGFRKLVSLVRHSAGYHVILPQDGVFTAAFTSLAAKLIGTRVVCVDHGNLTLLKSPIYRAERLHALATKSWSRPRRLLASLRYMCYWPSLSMLAGIAVRLVDHFLIPGVAGDSVEESCKRLGIHPSRITRFGSMIDIERHVVPDPASRAAIREEKGIPPNATVITMICRLAPEKGIDIALEALSQALATLPTRKRTLIRVIIAGDGPLRQQVEADICERGLNDICVLWGETSSEEVISLLGLTDIFLYTSRRGACFSMAVLEAMASACAVIATTEPLSNAHLLSAGRGIALPANDSKQIGMSLVRLISDPPLCRQMGDLARDYIAMYHSPAVFRRKLMRTTYWSGLDELLDTKNIKHYG